jgi:WhiB family redox-sensing transcriptional regulator
VFEALIGIYNDNRVDPSGVGAIIEMATRNASRRQVHETLSNTDLRDKVLGGISAALEIGAEDGQVSVPEVPQNAARAAVKQPREDANTWGRIAAVAPPSYNNDNWREGASCCETDLAIFFPEKGGSSEAKDAKRVCGACAVRGFCLQEALKNDEPYGVWGGLTVRERRVLRKKRQAT